MEIDIRNEDCFVTMSNLSDHCIDVIGSEISKNQVTWSLNKLKEFSN